MAGDKTKEQLDAEWWDAWWAADYSWAGLAQKEWAGWFVQADGRVRDEEGNAWPSPPPRSGGGGPPKAVEGATAVGTVDAPSVSPAVAGDPPPPLRRGGQPSTLQDYWRTDPVTGAARSDAELEALGELTRDPSGALWHVVHVPVEWRKSSGAVLHRDAGEVAAKPPEGAATGGADHAPSASDLRSSAPPPLRRGGQSGPGPTWKSSLDHPDWARIDALVAARIAAGAETKLARTLRKSRIGWFPEGLDGRAQLDGAVLNRLPAHARPGGPPQAASRRVGMAQAVHITSYQARFLGPVDCADWLFGPGAWFDSATFSGDAWFNGATFTGTARFSSATFTGAAWFSRATFSGAAWFGSATFSGAAWFVSAVFRKDVWFTKAYEKEVAATFETTANFPDALFEGVARFEGARFRDRMTFDKAKFIAIADFSEVHVPDKEPHWRGAFDGALFESSLDLRGVDPRAVTLVTGATFDRGVLLDRVGEKTEGRAHNAALKLALAKTGKDREQALRDLETGAVVLKQVMDEAGDAGRAQRFYRLEVRARARQSETKWTEKIFSALYALTADYGGSIGRPFVALTVALLGFAAGFWLWGLLSGLVGAGEGAIPWGQAAVEAFDFSWNNAFKPFAALSNDMQNANKHSFAYRLLFDSEGRVDLNGATVRVVSTVQSLFGIVMAFLVALAVRRRFQIGS